MFKFKKVFASITEFFTTKSREFEYELPTPVEVESAQKTAPTLMLKATVEPIAEPSPVKAAEPIAEPSPVKGPLFEASEALKESQERLDFLQDQAVLAAQEAAILDEVREVNNLVRKLAVEMGDQRLLPLQMEQRREAAASDNNDIAKMFEDLGF